MLRYHTKIMNQRNEEEKVGAADILKYSWPSGNETVQQSAGPGRRIAGDIVAAHESSLVYLVASLRQYHITMVGYLALVQLDADPGSGLEIARKMMGSGAAASLMIRKLEKGGYVSSVLFPEDRRKRLYQITDEGRAVLKKMHDLVRDRIAQAMTADDDGTPGDPRTAHQWLRENW